MQKKPRKPLVVTTDRVRELTKQDLSKVEGGHVPPKLRPGDPIV